MKPKLKSNKRDRRISTNNINRIGGLYGQVTRWGVFDKEYIAPTITAAMGQGGGHVPMIIENKTYELDNKDNHKPICLNSQGVEKV